ncbi:MAG: hypothetical protein P1V33_11345 [Pseudohongiella nitratireducens]|nr:hypothetical protein [Pseudohongiella nitratireducens]MDF1624052.1 hypothetical protein [Pseudohongiella nitratireducens]
MAKHITQRDIEKVTGIIAGWDGKLSWDALCDAVVSHIGVRPTRQTLSAHAAIKAAFHEKKKQQKLGVENTKSPQSLAVAAQRIARLENEREQFKAENMRLLQQFVVWQYNAYRHGLSKEQLNEPLPSIDRESGEE